MSDSRQHIHGRFFGTLLFMGIVFVLVWLMPVLLLKLFPNWTVNSQEPWLLDPQDLTWRRAVVNAAHKPGFRLIPAVGVVLVMVMGQMTIRIVTSGKHRLKWQVLGERLNEMRLRQSMEWVVEENRPTELSEYARWLRSF